MRVIPLAERIAQEVRRRNAPDFTVDPVGFASSIGLTPDLWQRKVLLWKGTRLLLNCSRQAGKSTTTAALALHRATYTPGSLVLLISPSLRQSGELFRKVLDFVGKLPIQPELREENVHSLRLANGSRIVSLPSSKDTIRGFSAVSLIIADESAYIDDEIITAVRPMLAVSGGQLIMMSTPNGRRGHFFEAWEREGEAWDRIKITAWEVPRISRAFLDAEKASMGERFAQEYEGEFINATTGRVYSGFDEKRDVTASVPPGGAWTYLFGMDVGIVDRCAVTVLGWQKNSRVVYAIESYKLTAGPTEFAEEIRRLEQKYKPHQMVLDTGGMGKAFEWEMRSRYNLPVVAADKHAKVAYISLLNDALRTGLIRVVQSTCKDLIQEWIELPWAAALEERSENKQKEAEGFDNHCFIAGTLIETDRGSIPIEQIAKGDMVHTRQGLQEVTFATPTRFAEIWKLETEQGRELYGTATHPVLTERGFVHLQSLTPCDTLLAWANTDLPKQLSSKTSSTGDIQSLRYGLCASTTAVPLGNSYTEQSGPAFTDVLSLKNTISITSTETRSIMTRSTWKQSQRANIYESTPWSRIGWRSLGERLRSLFNTPLHGTGRRPAESGTLRTAPFLGRIERIIHFAAKSVRRIFSPRSLPQACAAVPVMPKNGEIQGWTMKPETANSAARPFERTSTESLSFARDRVMRITPTQNVELVYNLSVADVHEYFANGILVSNCSDATLYGWRAALAFLERPVIQDIPEGTSAWEDAARDRRATEAQRKANSKKGAWWR